MPEAARGVVHVADVQHGLGGEQEELAGELLLVLGLEGYRAGALAPGQRVLVSLEHPCLELGGLVAAGLRLLQGLGQAALHGLQVLELELHVYYLLVAHRVHRAVHVGDVVIVKTAQHMDYGVRLAYVGQELVAEALALGGTLHQAGYVHYLHGGGHHAARLAHLHELVEALVRDGDDPHVGLYGAEREIGRLGLGVAQTVEERGLAHVGESHYAALKCHIYNV